MSKTDHYASCRTEILLQIAFDLSHADTKIAAECLFFRYRDEMIKKAVPICRNRNLDTDQAIEIVRRSFVKFFKAKKFNLESSRQSTTKQAVLAYLYSILRNELSNYCNEAAKIKAGKAYSGEEGLVTDLPKVDSTKLTKIESMIYQYLLSLSKAKLTVYLTYKSHQIPGTKLPRPLLAKLRSHLNISQNSVRIYKNEVSNRITDIERMHKEFTDAR